MKNNSIDELQWEFKGIVDAIPWSPKNSVIEDLDFPLIDISSRVYLGNNEYINGYVEFRYMGNVILETEVFSSCDSELKRKVKEWIKENYLKALQVALQIAIKEKEGSNVEVHTKTTT